MLSHSQGISKYEVNSNRFVQFYNNSTGAKKLCLFIGEEDSIIYFYTNNGYITSLSNQTFKVVNTTQTGLPDFSSNTDYRPKVSDNIINHKTALLIKSSIYLWDLQKEKLVSQSESIPDISPFFIRMKSENEVYYYTYKINNALNIYNFNNNTISKHIINGMGDETISRCNVFPWQKRTLISFNNKLFITDKALKELKLELVNFQNKPVAGSMNIVQIKEDDF